MAQCDSDEIFRDFRSNHPNIAMKIENLGGALMPSIHQVAGANKMTATGCNSLPKISCGFKLSQGEFIRKAPGNYDEMKCSMIY